MTQLEYRQVWRDVGHSGNPAASILLIHSFGPQERGGWAAAAIEKWRREAQAAAGVPKSNRNASALSDMYGTPKEVVEGIHRFKKTLLLRNS